MKADDKATLCKVQSLVGTLAELVSTAFTEETVVNVKALSEPIAYLSLVLEMEINTLDEHSQD